jgi:hypothetical protein
MDRQADGSTFQDEVLGTRLTRALEAGGTARREGLRRVGDVSLFVSGFFADSLNRRLVDVDYYISLGGLAYGALGRREEERLAEVFSELAEKFTEFVDVIAEVSDRSALASNGDLLRLYEKWMKTGSARNGEMLIERGILPIRGSRRVQ